MGYMWVRIYIVAAKATIIEARIIAIDICVVLKFKCNDSIKYLYNIIQFITSYII